MSREASEGAGAVDRTWSGNDDHRVSLAIPPSWTWSASTTLYSPQGQVVVSAETEPLRVEMSLRDYLVERRDHLQLLAEFREWRPLEPVLVSGADHAQLFEYAVLNDQSVRVRRLEVHTIRDGRLVRVTAQTLDPPDPETAQAMLETALSLAVDPR